MISKEKRGHKNTARELPIFRMETELHEVYYLQVYEDVMSEELPGIQAHMAKGVQRIAGWYGGEVVHNAYLVYTPAFEKWLQERKKEEDWQKCWNLPHYQEYMETCNLNFLLRQLPAYDCPRHLIVLGDAIQMQEWIEGISRYMKKITFFSVTKPRGYESLREHLLDAYGLIANWVDNMQPVSEEPALVVDYCCRKKIYIWDVARGSIWIDMTSMEARRHAVEDRDTGIRYISLKSFWQEEMIQTLDTAGKIQYNT